MDIESLKLDNTENFYREIDSLVTTHKISYIDAIVHYCEYNMVEIETVAAVVNGNVKIKAAIQLEYEKLNYLPKSDVLPI